MKDARFRYSIRFQEQHVHEPGTAVGMADLDKSLDNIQQTGSNATTHEVERDIFDIDLNAFANYFDVFAEGIRQSSFFTISEDDDTCEKQGLTCFRTSQYESTIYGCSQRKMILWSRCQDTQATNVKNLSSERVNE